MFLTELLTKLDPTSPPKEEPDGWAVHCPAHDDSNPSLRVAVDGGTVLLHCRAGCETGAVLDSAGLSWADLRDAGVDTGHVPPPPGSAELSDSSLQLAANYVDAAAQLFRDGGPDGPAAVYAARFGVSFELGCSFGLGFDPGGPGGIRSPLLSKTHRSVPRLIVPFRSPWGDVTGWQGRLIGDDEASTVRWAGPLNPPGEAGWGRTGWFGPVGGPVVICEGPGDALTVAAAGVRAVGVRGAAHVNDEVVAEVAAAAGGGTVFVAGDNDPAGRQFSGGLTSDLVGAGADARWLQIPDGAGDITDWFGQSSEFREELVRAMGNAQPHKALDVGVEATHVDIAEHIVGKMGGAQTMAWVSNIGFHHLVNGVWRSDVVDSTRHQIHALGGEFKEAMKGLTAAAAGKPADSPEQQQLKRANKTLRLLRHSKEIDSIITEVRSMVGVDQAEFDRHKHLLPCHTGVVDLRTGEVTAHEGALRFTKGVDVKWDPSARAPRWEQFIGEVMGGDREMHDWLQRWVGYCLTGETGEQAFAIFVGGGANGKSVFTDTLARVFGGITSTVPFSTFELRQAGGIPNDIAALRGARIVLASEGERGRQMSESLIKTVTGQDQVTARYLHQEFFSFTPQFKLMLSSNHKPAFRSADEGLWRRIKLVEWNRFFKPHERDPGLADKLAREAPGILQWAVDGAVAWYEMGLADPPRVSEATARYRRTSDPLAGFFPNGPITSGEGSVPSARVWEMYRDWLDDEGLGPKDRWSRQALFAALEERGLSLSGNGRSQVFLGVQETKV